MKAAPALTCTGCQRRIGKAGGHYLLTDKRLICRRCVESKSMHGQLFPACPERWHDMLDHLECTGTRAGIAHVLGLWPASQTGGAR